MERKFAIRGILENKKRFAGIYFVMVLSALLLLLCSVLRDSMNKSIIENRYNLYGSFRYSLEEYFGFDDYRKQLGEDPNVLRFGTMYLVGTADDHQISYYDENALELGRIRVDTGRLPEKGNEIAIEPTILLANGYKAEVGEKVTFNLVGLINPTTSATPKIATVEFTVSGLLKEYTDLWGFGSPILVSKNGSEYLKDYIGGIRYVTYLLETAETKPDFRNLVLNKNAYPKESVQNVTTLLNYAIWMIAAVSTVILLVCILFSVLKRTETWRFFRDLGATKNQVQKIVLWEGLYLSVFSLPIGALFGIAIAVGLMFVLPSPAGDRWYIAVSLSNVLLMFAVSVLAAAVGVVIPSFIVQRTPLLAGDRKVKQRKHRRRRSGVGYLSLWKLVSERMRAQRGVTTVLILVLLSCGVVSAFVIHLASYSTREIKTTAQYAQNGAIIYDRHYDRVEGMYDFFSVPYALGTGISYDYNAVMLTDEVVDEIEMLYGVEQVHRYMIKTEDSDWPGIEKELIDIGINPRDDFDQFEWSHLYTNNRFSETFGGISYLLYADLSTFSNTEYFNAYISAEQARAATCLVYCEEMTHEMDLIFGKSMSYYEDFELVPGAYHEHMWDDHPTEEELEEFFAQYHVMQWNEIEPDVEFCNATIWGVTGNEAELLQQASEGDIEEISFESGEECIIVLPDIYFSQKEINPEPKYPPIKMDDWIMDWQYLYENRDVGFYQELNTSLFADKALIQGYEVFSEDTIQVGDIIPVKYLDEVVEIKVGAILRELPDEMKSYPYISLRPYTIITGEEFFHRIPGYNSADAYECITVELNGKQPSSVVEMQVKQIVKPLNDPSLILSNLDSSIEALEQEALVNISTLVLFAVLYFAVVLIVLSIIFSISMESQRRRIAVLRALGMEVKEIQLSYLLESLFYSVIGFVGAVPVMLTVWGVIQYNTYGSGGPWLSYIFSNDFLSFMWWAYGLIFLAVTIGVLCTLYLPLQNFFKDNIIEQLQS